MCRNVILLSFYLHGQPHTLIFTCKRLFSLFSTFNTKTLQVYINDNKEAKLKKLNAQVHHHNATQRPNISPLYTNIHLIMCSQCAHFSFFFIHNVVPWEFIKEDDNHMNANQWRFAVYRCVCVCLLPHLFCSNLHVGCLKQVYANEMFFCEKFIALLSVKLF